MTWEQAQGWLATMTQYMQVKAAERAELQAGAGLEIQGPLISLDPRPRTEPAAYEPTWSLVVYGRVTGTGASEEAIDTGWEVALRNPRGTDLLLPGSIWQSTTHFSLTGEGDEQPTSRVITLELQSRGYEVTVPEFEAAEFYTSVMVTVSVMRNVYSEGGSLLEQVEDRTEEFLLRRSGASQTFVADRSDEIYELRLKSISRI